MTAVFIALLTAFYILVWAYPASCDARLEKKTLSLRKEMELLKKGIEAHRIIYGEYPPPPLDESLLKMKGYIIPSGVEECEYTRESGSYTLKARIRIRKKRILFTNDSSPSITVRGG